MTSLATPNLTLRAFCDEDIDALYEIMRDAEAMQYTYKAPSRGHCVERLRAYAELERTLGYAPWTVSLAAEDRVIGWGGLNIDPFDPGWGVEVAYCLHRDFWGRGYATEVVHASLTKAFDQLSIPTVVAFAHQENLGSIRVLEKCGFRLLGYEPQLDRNHYQIHRSDWLVAHQTP